METFLYEGKIYNITSTHSSDNILSVFFYSLENVKTVVWHYGTLNEDYCMVADFELIDEEDEKEEYESIMFSLVDIGNNTYLLTIHRN